MVVVIKSKSAGSRSQVSVRGKKAGGKLRVFWLVPDQAGGIGIYAQELIPAVAKLCELGFRICGPLDRRASFEPVLREIAKFEPDIVHIHHEFGLFGSKLPPWNTFSSFIQRLRARVPYARVIATAHTVLDQKYELPWKGRAWQTPVRWLLNRAALPYLRKLWTRGTWGLLDGVIVHSLLQVSVPLDSGCLNVEAIPLAVPDVKRVPASSKGLSGPLILVFGFISPEKGQDVIIRALPLVPVSALPAPTLVIAGGIRRPQDDYYLQQCRALITELGIEDRVRITGFVPDAEILDYYQNATLVVAPFRETSGSATLAQAFARETPVLTSDLPLNRELNERVPGCVALFKSEDPQDCARAMAALLVDTAARHKLAQASGAYAKLFSGEKVAARHLQFYAKLGC